MNREQVIRRYTGSERCNHWLLALSFILTALSGLGFFHPGLCWLTNLFGGGTWARILHPYFAVVMVVVFLVWMIRIWKYLRFTTADRKWAVHIPDMLRNRMDKVPPSGKYNFGQKMLARTQLVLILLLLLTGVVIWQPLFADAFSVFSRRIAVLTHSIAAFVAVLSLIVHVYAAIWTKGAVSGMVLGRVSTAWARYHNRLWYEEKMQVAHDAQASSAFGEKAAG
ncbi:MAG: formate dehydrogenase subunit gamma [Desulfobulbaceae bacterium]|nr:formate dehydrogenase subunit gamma [Desulfobulbaceae bacterium]